MVLRNLSRQRGVSGIDIARTPRREAESQAAIAPESIATGSQANTLLRPHFPMGGGIGTADQPPQAPSAPEFGQLHQGGWPLTLPPEPGSGLVPVDEPDFPGLEQRSPVGGSEGEDSPEPDDGSEDEWSEDNIELRPCDVLPTYQVGGSSGSRKEILGDKRLTSVLCDKEPEPEPMAYSYYTNLITGEVFKFDGKILDPDDWKDCKRYRNV